MDTMRPVHTRSDGLAELGTYLMAALPNSTIIGFTGTPIARTEHGEGTFKILGADDEQGYLDKYSISESIKDETTLPIRHMMAPSEMTVPSEQLDREFFTLAEMEGITDVDELNRVLDRAVGLRTFLTADDTTARIPSIPRCRPRTTTQARESGASQSTSAGSRTRIP